MWEAPFFMQDRFEEQSQTEVEEVLDQKSTNTYSKY